MRDEHIIPVPDRDSIWIIQTSLEHGGCASIECAENIQIILILIIIY